MPTAFPQQKEQTFFVLIKYQILHLLLSKTLSKKATDMSDTLPIVDDIKQKISELVSQRNAWKQKAESCETEITGLQASLNELKEEHNALSKDNAMLKTAKSLNKGEVKNTETKLKINELVKEIDRCIALLNK